RKKTPVNRFLDGFNRGFDKLTGKYAGMLRLIVNRRVVTLAMLLAFCFGIVGITSYMPSGFIPSEDQGMLYAIVQTPPGATLERTNDVARKLQLIARDVEGIQSVSSLAGY